MPPGNRSHRRGHRKCLFRQEMVSEGYKLGALGLTIEEMARFWNIGISSLKRYAIKYPELEISLKKGRTEADLTVIQSLLDAARKGDMTATIFWLCNRRRGEWQHVQRIEHSGKIEGNVEKIIVSIVNTHKKEENASNPRIGSDSSLPG